MAKHDIMSYALTPIAGALAALSGDAIVTVTADRASEASLRTFADSFRPSMTSADGTQPGDLDFYYRLCRAWRATYEIGYRGASGVFVDFEPTPERLEGIELTEASQKALERRFAAARGFIGGDLLDGFQKPKATTTDAERMARARAAVPEGTVETWRAKAAEALAAGDIAAMSEAANNAKKLDKMARDEARKAAEVALKARKEEFDGLVQAIKGYADAAAYDAAITALRKIVNARTQPTSTRASSEPAPTDAPKGTGKVQKGTDSGKGANGTRTRMHAGSK